MSNAVEKFDPTKPAPSVTALRDFLLQNQRRIADVASSVITPERIVRIVASSASRNPKLASSTPLSILQSCMDAAEMGLEPESGMDEAYLVPYYNKQIGAYEAQCIVGYKGLCRLVRQSGEVTKIEAHVVYANDEFRWTMGAHPDLVHNPFIDGERGDVRAFYGIAWLKNGESQFEVMSKAEVDAIRDRGRGNDKFSPWQTDYTQMGRKTALRRLCNYLPKDKALAKALEVQAHVEAGTFLSATSLPEVADAPAPRAALPATKTDALRDQLSASHVAAGPVAPVDEDPGPDVPHGAPVDEAPTAPPVQSPASMPVDEDGYGPNLSAKQIASCKGAADKLDIPHDLSRAVIQAVSKSEKGVARAFVDEVFSRDNARIGVAFMNHPSAAPFKAV